MWISFVRKDEKKMGVDKDELLSKLKELLKGEVSTISYDTWFAPLGIDSIKDNHIVFTATSEFQQDFIENKFNSLIFNTLRFITNKEWTFSVIDLSKEENTNQNIIADKLDISPKSVHAYVIGEHGNSQFVPWSNAKIGLEPISNYLSHEDMINIEDETRNFGFKIAQKKNYTCFGIASALTRITSAIIADEKAIICVSSYDPVQKIFISTPSVIGINGVEKTGIMTLNQEEIHKFETSANIIRNAINEI